MNGFLADFCVWRSTRLLIGSRRWARWARLLDHRDRLTSARLLFNAHWREMAERGIR